jgi:putative transposase
MTRSRFSERQINGILKEHEAGVSIVRAARRLKTLEDENTRLTELLADALMEIAILQDRLGRKG